MVRFGPTTKGFFQQSDTTPNLRATPILRVCVRRCFRQVVGTPGFPLFWDDRVGQDNLLLGITLFQVGRPQLRTLFVIGMTYLFVGGILRILSLLVILAGWGIIAGQTVILSFCSSIYVWSSPPPFGQWLVGSHHIKKKNGFLICFVEVKFSTSVILQNI